jgi:hypothetical protein
MWNKCSWIYVVLHGRCWGNLNYVTSVSFHIPTAWYPKGGWSISHLTWYWCDTVNPRTTWGLGAVIKACCQNRATLNSYRKKIGFAQKMAFMRQAGQSKKMMEAQLSFEKRKTITILIQFFLSNKVDSVKHSTCIVLRCKYGGYMFRPSKRPSSGHSL